MTDSKEKVRAIIGELQRKFTPTRGCENCWGDLYQGCSEECKAEFRAAHEFGKRLWAIYKLGSEKEN